MDNLPNPNTLFKDCPGATLAPPWEPFWDCKNFASDDCPHDCDGCTVYEDSERF